MIYSARNAVVDCHSIHDDSTAQWKVATSSSAVLFFNISAGSVVTFDGDFVFDDDGKFEVDSSGLQTTSSLHWTGGTIEIATGYAMEFGYVAP